MKPATPVLLLSLAANLALAALVYSRHVPDQRAPLATRSVAPAAPANGVTVTQPLVGLGANPADVDYLVRLRASGMPPDLIRDLLFMRIQARYRDRRRALLPEVNAQYWQSWNQGGWAGASSETRAQLRQLDKELAAELRALLGDSPDSLSPFERRLYDQVAGVLSSDKIQQVEAIRKDYDEMAGQVRERGKGLVLKADREQLRLLESERRRDFAALLSPEELLEYDLRASPTANNVRQRLAYFEPTEEEYRAMAKLQLEFDRQYGLSNLSGAEQERRRAAEKDLLSQLQSALTPARYADYLVTIDGMFSETRTFTNAYNMDPGIAKEIVSLKQSTWKRLEELDRTGATSDQRAAAMKALELEVDRQLTTRLGAEIYAKYQKSGASWLNRLRPTPPKS